MDTSGIDNAIEIASFGALTIGIVVYFIGMRLSQVLPFLARYSIPEPVSGGLLAAFVALIVVWITGREVVYDLETRDILLVYFFTTVGLNARISDLVRGGPVLLLMLALTLGFMVVQNAIGVLSAVIFGLPAQSGVLLGTASLIGGHGTAIAWGPTIANEYGVTGAAELGIATATLGLIAASLLGGPIAKFLIEGRKLEPTPDEAPTVSASSVRDPTSSDDITHVGLMRSILWIHVAIFLGYAIFELLEASGIRLPLFVPCLMSGIVLSNVMPKLFARVTSPAGTPALSVISEFSLSVFLSMSLMSMQLWTLAGSAGVLTATILLQVLASVAFIVFVVFRVMGQNYFAAVISAGFAGFALGATPTAVANMNSVTQRYGACALAFIVLPLVSAFFVDIANALAIQWTLLLTDAG